MSDRPLWDRDGRDWPNRANSRFVRAGELEWHVQVAGDGPVLLLLHGTGAATHSWRDVLPILAKTFTVVAPDLPGHGFTRGVQRQGPTLPNVARALAALLARLDAKPSIVVGHSAGAAVALRMTLDGLTAPRAAIALSPALLPFPGLAAQLFPTLAKMIFLNPFVPHLAARMAGSPRDVARFLVRATGSQIDARGIDLYTRLFRCPGHVRGTIALMANWDLEPLQRDLPRFGVPLTVLHGDRDAAIEPGKAREAAALVPGARFDLLAGQGHLAHEEQPALIAERIAAFASAHLADRE